MGEAGGEGRKSGAVLRSGESADISTFRITVNAGNHKRTDFQAEDGIRDYYASRGLGDVYKRQGVRKPI